VTPLFGGDRASREPRSGGDKGRLSYWRGARPGDYVSLSDLEAFEEALASGTEGRGAADFRVGQVRAFALRGPGSFPGRGRGARAAASAARRPADAANGGRYYFIELTREGSGPLYLAAVPREESDPDEAELRLYFIPSGIEGGTRDDFIDRGDSWLFLPPPDPEDFASSELEYAPYPDVPPIDEDGVERKLVFARRGPGCLYAQALDTDAACVIVEYEAEVDSGQKPPASPLLLILEEGWMLPDGSEPEEGGYLTLMLGKVLRTSEIEHWPA
jgi:hypothetical protein